MKTLKTRILSFFGIILVSAVIITFLAACPTDAPSDSNNSEKFPAPKGKLTISGLGSFNGKYVYAYGTVTGSILLTGLTDISGYPSDITFHLAKITNGDVSIPLYRANPQAASYHDSYIAYDGNHSISPSLTVIILNDSLLKSSAAPAALAQTQDKKVFSSGSFTNGNLNVNWDGSIEYFEFYLESGLWFIYKYTGTQSVVVLPSTHNGNSVTRLYNFAFENLYNLTTVTIPNNFSIMANAFYNVPNLSTIIIGTNVTIASSVTNPPFDTAFIAMYNASVPKNGTYIKSGSTWIKSN